MTSQEQKEYDGLKKLSPNGQRYYDEDKERNPKWSHNQIMAMVMIRISMENPPKKDSWADIMEALIKKACDNLKVNYPDVFIKVGRSLASLAEAIKNGILNTWEKIKIWFQNNFG